MRERGTALAVALGLAVAGLACSSAESKVVDQYFGALKANDQGTLTSFAMVSFDQKVDDWKIVAEGAEVKAPAALPDLVKKQKDLQAELDKNTRDARAWGNDLNVYPKLDQVRQAQQKGAKIPPALQPIADKWDALPERGPAAQEGRRRGEGRRRAREAQRHALDRPGRGPREPHGRRALARRRPQPDDRRRARSPTR